MISGKMWIWFSLLVIAACIRPYVNTDSCTKWRLKIHRDIEESGKTLDLGLFVNAFATSVLPEFDSFTHLQIQLEQYAGEYDNGSVYDPKSVEQHLLGNPEVQDIIQQCRAFHVTPNCSRSLYRSNDGTCNNLKHPLWGSSSYTKDRIFPATYEGISGFRKSVKGGELPEPRSISLKLKNPNNPSDKVSAFFTFYGQSLAHDMSLIPGITNNGTLIGCCDDPYKYNSSICLNNYFSENDPFYEQFNYTCVPLPRTAPFPTCNFDRRIQMNKITSFLDMSLIYGSTVVKEKEMRTDDGSGRLKMQNSKFGDLLPKALNENALFCPINETEKCFLSGDERVNQHTLLISMHTMYVRLHNLMHDILHSLNPHWKGDKLYQETRRIVNALQHYMVYSEYLPRLVGKQNMKKYNLTMDWDRGSLYDDEIRPNMLVEFSTASFRLHSMVPKQMSKYHPRIRFDLSYSFTCPIHKGQLDSYVGGSNEVSSERNDHFVKDDIKDYLYRPPRATYGDDLASVNIARGRDHGLPIYVDAVHKCSDGKVQIKKFSDLKTLMTLENIRLLKSIYLDVRDIDLWVGIILEREIKDAVTGPTAACISSIYFNRIKFGDSFYFTHTNGRYPFAKAQLQAIKTYSMSRWICDTTGKTRVRKYPLELPGRKNPLLWCKKFPPFNLSAWKEKK